MIVPYNLPLSGGKFRQGFLIEKEGHFGDVAPYPGFSQETYAEALEEAELVLRNEAEPTLPSVKFAFECLKSPLPKLRVPVNALDQFRPGFTALKLKVGHLSVQEAIELIKVQPPFDLRLDFNRKWTLPMLLEFAKHFSPEKFDYLEEPTSNFEDIITFSKLTGFPIALDESIPFVPYEKIPTLKALVVKPTILGFIPIPPKNVELIFSSAFESGIGVAHIARLAWIHNPDRPHGLDPYSHFITDIITPRPTISDGHFHFEGNPKRC